MRFAIEHREVQSLNCPVDGGPSVELEGDSMVATKRSYTGFVNGMWANRVATVG